MVRINPLFDFDPGATPSYGLYRFRVYNFEQLSPKQYMHFRIFLSVNKVRVSNHQPFTYTQIQVHYPLRDFDSVQTNALTA